eukprot:7762497-Prorocentrum_lima.AAC.1
MQSEVDCQFVQDMNSGHQHPISWDQPCQPRGDKDLWRSCSAWRAMVWLRCWDNSGATHCCDYVLPR